MNSDVSTRGMRWYIQPYPASMCVLLSGSCGVVLGLSIVSLPVRLHGRRGARSVIFKNTRARSLSMLTAPPLGSRVLRASDNAAHNRCSLHHLSLSFLTRTHTCVCCCGSLPCCLFPRLARPGAHAGAHTPQPRRKSYSHCSHPVFRRPRVLCAFCAVPYSRRGADELLVLPCVPFAARPLTRWRVHKPAAAIAGGK